MLPVLLTAFSTLVLVIVLAVLYHRLALSSRRPAFSAEWWSEFSPERYRPLQRLLSQDDFEFVRTLPGYQPGMDRSFRKRRIAVCRAYLSEMRLDFLRLQAVGQALIIAGKATPGLQDELFRQKVIFTRAWWRVRLQVAAYSIGVGSVDTSGLLEALDRTAVTFRPVLTPAA